MADQQFCLRWNNHQATLVSIFDTLLQGDRFTDCTLSAEGQSIAAHKILLTACSPYFDAILSNIRYDRHPVIILRDVTFAELQALMDYMYRGEVNISQDQLAALLKVAESLQIKGLSDSKEKEKTDKRAAPLPPPPPTLPTIPRTLSSSRSQAQIFDLPLGSPNRNDSNVSPVVPRKRSSKRRRHSSGDESNQTLPLSLTESLDSNSHDMSNISISQVATLLSKSTAVIPAPASTLLDHALPDSVHVNVDIPKIEPQSQELLQPKEEYVDDQDSVENITLDDDDDNMDDMDLSQAGPSHGGEGSSSQGYPPSWQHQSDRSTDEVFMAAQEAVGGQRDSQERYRGKKAEEAECNWKRLEATFENNVCPRTVLLQERTDKVASKREANRLRQQRYRARKAKDADWNWKRHEATSGNDVCPRMLTLQEQQEIVSIFTVTGPSITLPKADKAATKREANRLRQQQYRARKAKGAECN